MNFGATANAGFFVLAVGCHLGAKGGEFLRKGITSLCQKALAPLNKDFESRLVKPLNLVVIQILRERKRRQARGKQNLVRIRVADAAEHARVAQRTLRVIP